MRFNSVWVACSAFALAVCNASAEQVHAIFESNKENILENGVREAEGFRFGVGVGAPLTGNQFSQKAAQGKSELLATGDLIRSVALSAVEWPASISEKSRRALSEYYRFSVSATLSRVTKVYQVQEGKNWTTVVAVPAEQTEQVCKITFPELREQLLLPKYVFSSQAPDEAIVELFQTQKQPVPLEREQWEKFLSKAKFKPPYLHKLPLFAGRCDMKHELKGGQSFYEQGMAAYRKGKLDDAYGFFVDAAEKSWTFDVLNMAGNVARRIGKYNEAVPFLIHAAYLAPEKPFPWVHLAFVAKAQKDSELCEFCCREAEARKPDKWTSEQIAILREEIEENVSSEKAMGAKTTRLSESSGN